MFVFLGPSAHSERCKFDQRQILLQTHHVTAVVSEELWKRENTKAFLYTELASQLSDAVLLSDAFIWSNGAIQWPVRILTQQYCTNSKLLQKQEAPKGSCNTIEYCIILLKCRLLMSDLKRCTEHPHFRRREAQN